MKYFILASSILVASCMSSISMSEKRGCTIDYCESVAEATYKGRPKDLYDTSFTWPTAHGPMRFKTGAAVTTEDPWAEIVGDMAGPAVKAAICAQNPLLCNPQEQ